MQRVRKVCVAHRESADNDLGSRSAGDVHRTTHKDRSILLIDSIRVPSPGDILFSASPLSLIRDTWKIVFTHANERLGVN